MIVSILAGRWPPANCKKTDEGRRYRFDKSHECRSRRTRTVSHCGTSVIELTHIPNAVKANVHPTTMSYLIANPSSFS